MILVKNWKSLSITELRDAIEKMALPEPNTGCWLWERCVLTNGYCLISGRLAHRVSYEAFYSAIPSGMFVCHRCDTRACVNPDHLYLGTHADNMRDMKVRGRAASGPNHAANLYPLEFRHYGDRHWTRRMPERRRHGERNAAAKLTSEQVRQIIALSRTGRSAASLAREFGVSATPVRLIVRGLAWKNIER